MQATLLDILLKLLTLGYTDLIYDGQNRACEGSLHMLYYPSLYAARITNGEELLSCKAAVEKDLWAYGHIALNASDLIWENDLQIPTLSVF